MTTEELKALTEVQEWLRSGERDDPPEIEIEMAFNALIAERDKLGAQTIGDDLTIRQLTQERDQAHATQDAAQVRAGELLEQKRAAEAKLAEAEAERNETSLRGWSVARQLAAAEADAKALRERIETLGGYLTAACAHAEANAAPHRDVVLTWRAALVPTKDPPPGPPSSPDRCACGAVTLWRNPDPQASARDPLTGIVHARRECRAALAAHKDCLDAPEGADMTEAKLKTWALPEEEGNHD